MRRQVHCSIFVVRNKRSLLESDDQVFLTYRAKLLWDTLWPNKDVEKQKQKETYLSLASVPVRIDEIEIHGGL